MLHRDRIGLDRPNRSAHQSLLQGAGKTLSIAGREVPGGGRNDLVIGDAALM